MKIYMFNICGVQSDRGETDKVGSKNPFKAIVGRGQINNMNKGFFEQYGEKDAQEQGILKNIQRMFNGTKISDYNRMVEEISKLQRGEIQHDNSIVGEVENGDSRY